MSEKLLATKFRLLMTEDNMGIYANTYGTVTDQEQEALVAAAVEEEFNLMHLDKALSAYGITNLKDQERELNFTKKIVCQVYPSLIEIFKFYCGFGSGDSTATMSNSEFTHFVRGVGLFAAGDHRVLSDIFYEVNREDLGGEDTAQKQSNPDDELLRFEFIESLVRLAMNKYNIREEGVKRDLNPWGGGIKTFKPGKIGVEDWLVDRNEYDVMSAATAWLFREHILPKVDSQLELNPLREGLREDKVQACFQQHIRSLERVYQYYATRGREAQRESTRKLHGEEHWRLATFAVEYGGGQDRPTMNLYEFGELMRDSGLAGGKKQKDPSDTADEAPPKNMLDNLFKSPFDEHGRPKQKGKGTFVVNELTAQEARACFAGAQADTDSRPDELNEMVFSEFIEALARVALAKWEDPRIQFKDKVLLAVESVSRLEKEVDSWTSQMKAADQSRRASKVSKIL